MTNRMTSNNYRTLSNYNEEISSCQQAFITGSADILYPLCPKKLTECSKDATCPSGKCCGLSPFPGNKTCTIDKCFCSINGTCDVDLYIYSNNLNDICNLKPVTGSQTSLLEYCEDDKWPSNWNKNFKDKICDRFKPCDSCNTCNCSEPDSKSKNDCVYHLKKSNDVAVHSTTQYKTGDVVWGRICSTDGQCKDPQTLYIMNEDAAVGFSYSNSKDGLFSECCGGNPCPPNAPCNKDCLPSGTDVQLFETEGWPTRS